MLVQAAAKQWQVEAASCTTSKSVVGCTGKVDAHWLARLLAGAASSETPPKNVALKKPEDFVYIGQSLKRFRAPDKVNGKAVYGIDAILPNMASPQSHFARCLAAKSARSTTALRRRLMVCRRS